MCNRIGVDYVIDQALGSAENNKNKKTSKLNKNAKQIEGVQQSAKQMANSLGNLSAKNTPAIIDQNINNLLMMRRLEVYD